MDDHGAVHRPDLPVKHPEPMTEAGMLGAPG
jgi:hypothetical protein